MNFKLYRKVSVTFEFSKQNFCWNNLNRKDYMKFAQKTEQKTIKLFCKIKTEKKHTFCHNWWPTARQRPVRHLLAAAQPSARLKHGPRPV
jgi:hypothetical protein